MGSFIKSLLSGNDGSISTTRFLTITVVLVILCVYIAQNIMALLKCGGYVDFPANTVMAMLVVMGAKVGQSFSENMNKNSVDAPNTDKVDSPN